MDHIVYWVGAGSLTLIGSALLCVLYVLGVAFIAAVSVVRWRMRVCKVHRLQPRWKHLPALFVETWIDFIPYEKGRITMRSPEGNWNGIGDWVVHPRKTVSVNTTTHTKRG